MIEQNVQVLRCENERLWVRMGTRSGCTACDNGKGCGAGLFAKLVRNKPVVLELARNELEVESGQMLTLAVPEQVYLKLVFASYGWPLLAALAGAFTAFSIAAWLQLSPVLVDAATLTGGILAAWLIIRLTKQRRTVRNVLSSLDISICFSSATPNICSGSFEKPEHN
ncbi:MAG: SoxR reducing system RseC family protein [Xanthomonadales bacterium]|nr:SoxR reducing system RseC family protein [Xanthomonadales bacterium]